MRDNKGYTVYDYYLKDVVDNPECRDLSFQYKI